MDEDLKNILGEPDVKPQDELVSLLGEPDLKKKESSESSDIQSPYQETNPDVLGAFKNKENIQQGVNTSLLNQVGEAAKQALPKLESKFINYVGAKRKELTGGLELPDPLNTPPEQYKQDIDNYARVLRENPMPTAEDNKITAVRMLLDKTKQTNDILDTYSDKTIAEKVGEGVKQGLEDYGRGYFEFFDQLKQNDAIKQLNPKLEALNKGENVQLDEGDKLLMQALYENGIANQKMEELNPTAYRIGESAGQSLGFTGEFLLTGGIGAGLAKGITKGVATKIAEGATVSAAKKIGIGLAAKAAQTGVQTLAMPTLYRNIAEDVSRGENFAKSVLKEYYNTFSENFTERIFLRNPWNKETVGAVDNFISRMGVNMHTEKGALGILTSTLEETAEEKIGEIMQAPLNYDNFKDFWKNYWDVEKNGELIGSVALMTVPMGLVSYSAKKYDDVQTNRIGKLLPTALRSEIDQVLDDKKLTLKEQYDLIGKIVEDNADNKTLGEKPGETAGDVIRYVQNKTRSNVLSSVEERAKTVGTIEEVSIEDQAKVDYLASKGVTIPDGSTMEQVTKLYDEEKAKEIPEKQGTTQAEIKPVETPNLPVEQVSALKGENVPPVEKAPLQPTRIEELDGSIVSYDGVRGKLVKTDTGYFVEDKEGNRVFVESGESGQSAEELGVFKEKDAPVYHPEDSSIDYLGNKYKYDSVNVDKDGNTVSINVTDEGGNRKTIRDQFVIEEIEYQKALSEFDETGVDNSDVETVIKDLNIKEYGQEPITTSAEKVQQEGQNKGVETPVGETKVTTKTKQNESEIRKRSEVQGTEKQVSQTGGKQPVGGRSVNRQKKVRKEEVPTISGTGTKESQIEATNKPVEPLSVTKQVQVPPEQKEAFKGTKQELRAQRIAEIDNELGDVWSSLADIVGVKVSLTGEQRAKLMPVVTKLVSLYAEKYSLKGQNLIDEVVAHLRSKNIEPDEELLKEINNAEQEQQSSQVRQGRTETGKGQGSSDSNLSGIDQTGVQVGQETEKVRQHGVQTGTYTKAGGTWGRLAEDYKTFYKVKGEQEQIDEAAAWLSERDDATILNTLSKNKTGNIEQRQNRRKLFLMYLDEKYNKAVELGDMEKAESLWEDILKIDEKYKEEGTIAGRAVQQFANFKHLTEQAAVFAIDSEIRKQNQKKYPHVQLGDVNKKNVTKAGREIIESVIGDKSLDEVVSKVSSRNKNIKTQTYSEKAKQVADKVRSIKPSSWGLTLAGDPISSTAVGVLDGALELTAKVIETSGNILDAIDKGVNKIKRSDWYKGLTDDQKRKVERQYAFNVKKDLGVDTMDKDTLSKYLKKELKDMKMSINDVVKRHWTEEHTVGQTLSERLVSDLGLNETDAKLIQDKVYSLVKEQLAEKIDKEITKLPKSAVEQKNFVSKMGELFMMGNLDEESFREYMGKKLGLAANITAEQAERIKFLNKALAATENMGVFGDMVANQYAFEIDKLIPETKTQRLLKGMIGVDYANALSGLTTRVVNVKSAIANAAIQPLMEATDLNRLINDFKDGRIIDYFGRIIAPWIAAGKVSPTMLSSYFDIIATGDIKALHKYISEVKSAAHLSVPELERDKFEGNRFKPIKIGNVDLNGANYLKYIGRELAAEDEAMTNGAEAYELSKMLYDKLRKEGVPSKEIVKQIERQVFGTNLTQEQQDLVDAQLAQEKEALRNLGFDTSKFKDNRRRLEIIRENFLDLDGDLRQEAKDVAKGYVFNDTRGGIINAIISSMSKLANKNTFTKLAIMPHFMFFRIMANIGDFMVDTIPGYGMLRAYGNSPTSWAARYSMYREKGISGEKAIWDAVFGEKVPLKDLPFRTAQLGEKGSYRFQQQKERIRIANMITLMSFAVVAGMYALNSDDDSWFDITGGRFDSKDVYGRNQLKRQPYMLKIGKWKLNYNAIPILNAPLSMIGNYQDMVNSGMPEEEIIQRMKLMQRAWVYSLLSISDQQIMQGFKSMADAIIQLTSIKPNPANPEDDSTVKKGKSFVDYMAKEQLQPFLGWLPTKNNLVQQIMQIADPRKVESRGLGAILAYDAGVQKFTNNKAIDIFGEQTYSLPGYTNIYYEPLLPKYDKKRWELTQWLYDNGAFPQPYFNQARKILHPTTDKSWLDTKLGIEEKPYEITVPDENSFYDYRVNVGKMFRKDLEHYKNAEYNGKPVSEIESKEQGASGKTVMQNKVSQMLSDAKTQTSLYMYTWNELGKENQKLFDRLYEAKALPPLANNVDVFKRNLDNSVYLDENGDPVIALKERLVDNPWAVFNMNAFKRYMELVKGGMIMNDSNLRDFSKNMWKTAVNIESALYVPKE